MYPAILTICSVWFGFANPFFSFPLLVLSWPAILLHYASSTFPLRLTLKRSWLVSSAIFASCLYWVVYPVHYYGSLNWFLALPCPLLLGMYLGLFPTLFVLGSRVMKAHLPWYVSCAGSALLWTSLEYLRNTLCTGFPWLGLTQAFAPWPWAIQSLKYIGSFAFSGLLVLLTDLILLGAKQKKALAGTLCLLTFLLWPAFNRQLTHTVRHTQQPRKNLDLKRDRQISALNPGLNIGLIQGNIPQDQKWNADFQRQTLRIYLKLSRQAIQKEAPRLLVWPETALPFYLQLPSPLSREVRAFVKQNKILLLTGTPAFKRKADRFCYYNRACLLNTQGKTTASYDKTHLVPFGEYVPLQRILPWISRLVPGQGDFSPGRDHNPLKIENLALGVLICYEVIFPELAQREVQNRANLLINISNDGWFGPTSAPWQHLNQAVLRAVEQDRYLLRATNTGISAIIGPQGNILKKSSIFTRGVLSCSQVELRKKQTFFCRHFWKIKWFSMALTCIFLFSSWAVSRSRPQKKKLTST